MTAPFLAYINLREILLFLSLTLCLFVAWFKPLLFDRFLRFMENAGARLASNQAAAYLALGMLPIVVRLCLLWLIPVPLPGVMDEPSYLLAADTFAHGRLTNPPHPMWIFFDTPYVIQQPTYMSKYPPGQGAVLALGQLLGHPWIGVLLSVAAMSIAVLWMLRGWLPSRWAFLGAALLALRLAVFSYWMNSYWGGAVAAIGGALVIGALPRILRGRHIRDAIFLAIGAAILANSRPYEGLLLFLSSCVFLIFKLFTSDGLSWGVALRRIVIPVSAVLIPTLLFMGYYNWRVTGHPLLSPYVLNERQQSIVPFFIWQTPPPPHRLLYPQMEDPYPEWERAYWEHNRLDGIRHFSGHVTLAALKFVYFYLWPELCVPFLALPWILRDRRVRSLILQFAFCFVGTLAVVWSQPHYTAPLAAILFALIVQGMRHLRRWRYHGRPVGVGFSRAVVLFAVAMNLVYIGEAAVNPFTESFVGPSGFWANPGDRFRDDILRKLEATPGQHLVIVRHSKLVKSTPEWVYNRADIDHAKVVWAREIPGVDIRPLLDYFHGRQIWLIDPGVDPAKLYVYPGGP